MTFNSDLLALGPVGYWRLGETSGTAAVDSVGGHNGTYNGGVTLGTAGLVNDADLAASLDGTSGYVAIPYGTWMDAPQWTWLLVLKTTLDTSYNYIFFASDWYLETSRSDTGGGLYFQSAGLSQDHIGTITNDTATLIGVTYDGTAYHVFVGGTEAYTAADTYRGTGSTEMDVSTPSWKGAQLPGVVDEVAFFSKPLAAANFSTLAAGVGPGQPPPPPGADMQYGGYEYGSTSRVTYDIPVAPTPSGVTRAQIRRVHQSIPAPTLVNGRPT